VPPWVPQPPWFTGESRGILLGARASKSAVSDFAPASSTISGPDENRIAAAIGSARERSSTGGPDEAAVAGAIAGD
jgi:hypothetical protein